MDVADISLVLADPDCEEVQKIFKRFLEEYTACDLDDSKAAQTSNSSSTTDDPAPEHTQHRLGPGKTQAESGKSSKYAGEAMRLLMNDRDTLFVDFQDVELFDSNLANDIICKYYRFYPYLCQAVASYVREEKIRRAEANARLNFDIIEKTHARKYIQKGLFNPQIKNKDYRVGFYNFENKVNLRDLTAEKIGILTRVSGQVVRTYPLRVKLIIGCYKCYDCSSETYYNMEFKYILPDRCSNIECDNRQRFELISEKSKFTNYTKMTIQETQHGLASERFDVVVCGFDQIDFIQLGYQCNFVGTLLAIPIVDVQTAVQIQPGAKCGVAGGFLSSGIYEMNSSPTFLANACIIEGQQKPSVETNLTMFYRELTQVSPMDVDFTKEEIEKIQKMSLDTNILDNLCLSVFSSIVGNEDIKKSIILQLLGGVTKKTQSGSKFNGAINICLVGELKLKSLFLEIVTDLALVKTVYADGRTSSASDLTATVMIDNEGGHVKQAGALILANGGICCIDNIEQINLKEQDALLEPMRQQKISITKAGFTSTLNARASILAAANPIGGVYNTFRDLKSNISLSEPIMASFDLFFTLLQIKDFDDIYNFWSKIFKSPSNYEEITYSSEEIRLYLRYARKLKPELSSEVRRVIKEEFGRLRLQSTILKSSLKLTCYHMESLVRLSEAIAKVHCSKTVRPEYVKMASRFIEKSIFYPG